MSLDKLETDDQMTDEERLQRVQQLLAEVTPLSKYDDASIEAWAKNFREVLLRADQIVKPTNDAGVTLTPPSQSLEGLVKGIVNAAKDVRTSRERRQALIDLIEVPAIRQSALRL